MKHPLPRHALLAALAICLVASATLAQPTTPRYAEFSYDSTFHIGGHGLVPWGNARELRFDYLYVYGQNLDTLAEF